MERKKISCLIIFTMMFAVFTGTGFASNDRETALKQSQVQKLELTQDQAQKLKGTKGTLRVYTKIDGKSVPSWVQIVGYDLVSLLSLNFAALQNDGTFSSGEIDFKLVPGTYATAAAAIHNNRLRTSNLYVAGVMTFCTSVVNITVWS